MHYYQAVPHLDKPVIIMAHGNSDIGLNWTTLTWELEDDYNIYMVDARGHGLTDPPSPGTSQEAAARNRCTDRRDRACLRVLFAKPSVDLVSPTRRGDAGRLSTKTLKDPAD